MRIKMMAMGILMVVMVLLCGTAFGSSITLEGTTTGTFSVSGMTFVGQNFEWTTDIAGNATVNLGLLTWNGTTNITHVNDAFSLKVLFSEPTTTPNFKVFTADVWASWNGFNGFCDVWFDDVNTNHFTYTTAEGSGSFDLGIVGRLSNGYSWEGFTPHRWFGLGRNTPVSIVGQITNATFVETPHPTVPEPATMVLLGLGLVGLAGVRRKLKK